MDDIISLLKWQSFFPGSFDMKPCPQWLAEDMFWLAIEVARTNPFKFRGLLAWPFHQFQSAAKHTTLGQTGIPTDPVRAFDTVDGRHPKQPPRMYKTL